MDLVRLLANRRQMWLYAALVAVGILAVACGASAARTGRESLIQVDSPREFTPERARLFLQRETKAYCDDAGRINRQRGLILVALADGARSGTTWVFSTGDGELDATVRADGVVTGPFKQRLISGCKLVDGG